MHSTQQGGPAPIPLDVIVIGESLIDIVKKSTTTIGYPGGSPANVAYGLGRLGIPTGLLTAIGNDAHGDTITRHIESAGVQILPGSHSLEKTATATATLTADGSASYEFDITWQLAAVTPDTIPKIVHTGSIATFLEPGASRVRTLLQQCHQDCMVTYDPNIRPALLGSHHEAKNLFEELVQLTDVVKLSDEDANWLYPSMDLGDVATHILKLGARLAVITKGAQGSLLATPETRVNIPSQKTVVADTIGAGDAYMSALIMALLANPAADISTGVLEHLGRTASIAAAITVGRPGANPPTSEELHMELAGTRPNPFAAV